MNSRERFFVLLHNEQSDRPAVINPVSVVTEESVTALGLDFSKTHLDADSAAALACYSHDVLGFDSVMPYFSVVAEAAALGAEIRWGDNLRMPSQHSLVFSQPEQVKVPAGFLDHPATRCIIDAVRIIAESRSDALVIGKAMGPWTLCLHLYGVENTLIDTIDDSEKLSDMLLALVSCTKAFTAAQLEAGAHMVTIADHCTRNLVGPAVYDNLVKPLHKELNAEFPGKLILHCCGNTEDRAGLFAEAGFPLYHFESANDIRNMIKLAGGMKLTGCVNNPVTLMTGGRDDVVKQVSEILQGGIDIVSPECAIPLCVPNDNLRAIVDCCEGHRRELSQNYRCSTI